MSKPDPAGSSPEASERQAVAELLGRILADHWLRRRDGTGRRLGADGEPDARRPTTARRARPVE